ncbi:MAG: hypothetical protein DMF34_07180 [Verrucomicrobia bacterium]|nr:MAG: hypothetical protein DMF34_07180 [Verrucomicrobiota bacterium]
MHLCPRRKSESNNQARGASNKGSRQAAANYRPAACAPHLNFIAFWRFGPQPQPPTGVMVAIFSIAIAAAEAAVGLALVIAVYRHYRTTNVDQLNRLKG